MSFTYQSLNQYDNGTFTKIVSSGLETESQDAHATLSCLADEVHGDFDLLTIGFKHSTEHR